MRLTDVPLPVGTPRSRGQGWFGLHREGQGILFDDLFHCVRAFFRFLLWPVCQKSTIFATGTYL